MKLKIICIMFIVMSLFSCSKEGDKQANKNYKHKLVLYATEEFRKSGFEHSIVPDFQNKHNCKLEVVLFPNTAELCNAVKDKKNYGKYDLAIGIDNSFAVSETLAAYFVPPESFNEDSLIKETMFDPSLRLIPFAYSNLSLVYNVSLIKNPPQSFGELQDAKYLAQIAICDPMVSGLGRATLLWSVALFGPDGYEYMWQSLRKNIYKTYSNQSEALEALKKGECSLMIGYNTTSAFLQEMDPMNRNFEISMLKEGSFQYIESIGIHRGTQKSALCSKFVDHLLSAETQKMVIYKMGMFPANRKTLLPMHFSAIPFITYSVNDRISNNLIQEQIFYWLDFWERLFGYQI